MDSRNLPDGGQPPVRVAAYCRVSTDKEDQRNSLAAQRAFFLSYIQDHPAWTLVGVFADEGLSGTSAKGRPAFSGLIRRAMAGEIDLILTKEVSRFARNTVDTLQITRQLKERGVGVRFLSDNLDTMEGDGEFRLAIMASVAQEESRKISQRTRWGQLQAMRRGVVFGNDTLYGYTLRHGSLTVEPGQAEVVALIYQKFLTEGKGAHTIARELTQEGVRPPLRPHGPWSSATVLRILHNEKYTGDLLQKKYRTTDYLTHRKMLNNGAEEPVYLPGHHQAIVSREEFQAVQAELTRRAGLAGGQGRYSGRYWYSGKIRCASCGKTFTLKRTRRPDGREYGRFVCRGRVDGSGCCQMRAVPSQLLLAVARRAVEALGLDAPSLAQALAQALSGDQGERTREAEGLRQAICRQRSRRERAVEAYLDGSLTREELQAATGRCREELEALQNRLDRLETAQPPDLSPQSLQSYVEEQLSGGDGILEEVIGQITVEQEDFLVELSGLPTGLRIRAQGTGTGPNYRVQVTQCAFFPLDSAPAPPRF